MHMNFIITIITYNRHRNFWQICHSSPTLPKLSCIQYTQAKAAHLPRLECDVLHTISIAMLNSNNVHC